MTREEAEALLDRIRVLALLGARTEEGQRILMVRPEVEEIIRDNRALARVVVEAAGLPVEELLEPLVERLVAGWDKWGAPTTARNSGGVWIGSFEGPGEPFATEAKTRREAYQRARREWFRRILGC